MSDGHRTRQIVAIGGGGLSTEQDNLALEHYVISLTEMDRPRICFVPTASGDAQTYIDRFYAAAEQLPCEPSHLSLFRGETPDLASVLLNHDVIYVGGGNTRNLLTLWRDWGVDKLMREAWQRGIVLTGVSAGSICWFEQGTTDSIPGDLTALSCLGFLPGSNSPHYDSEEQRRPTYHRLIASGEMSSGYAADDGVGLHWIGTRLERVISSRPDARAYRVERRDDSAVESEIVPDYLGELVR